MRCHVEELVVSVVTEHTVAALRWGFFFLFLIVEVVVRGEPRLELNPDV